MTHAPLLSAWLTRFEPGQTVWKDGGCEWRAEGLTSLVAAARPAMAARFRGAAVALDVRRHLDLARMLLVLDGTAHTVLLAPADWSPTTRLAMFQSAGITQWVTDASHEAVAGVEPAPLPDWAREGHGPGLDAATAGEGLDTRVVIPTSGTTGTPKLVSHSWATLTRTVKAPSGAGPGRWGLLYDLNRFAGLQVFLQALASRATLLFTDALPDLESRLGWLAAEGCDALSATPTLWRKILMSPAAPQLPLRQITLGGEIADDAVLAALSKTYPQARVTHVYASTEAGVGFSVKDGRAGFPADYLERAPGGVGLKVEADGRLWLRPPVRGQFYVGASELEGGDGWIDSGDLVRRDGDRFHFLGRANGAINVGGDKVFPEEVERVILELPEIALARVSGRRNPIVGTLVQASVMPRDPSMAAEAVRRRVQEHCAARLPRFKVPAVIQVEAALATEGSGKLARGTGST